MLREEGAFWGEASDESGTFYISGLIDKNNRVSFSTEKESGNEYYQGTVNEAMTEMRGTWSKYPNAVDPTSRGEWVVRRHDTIPPKAPAYEPEDDFDENVQLRADIPDTPAWRKAHKFVMETIRRGKPFTDPDFKPDESQLWNSQETPSDELENLKYVAHKLKWVRATEMYEDPKVFCNKIEPNDVMQGAIGTCYFLAACAAMAETPDRIRARFYTQIVNKAGIFLVGIFVGGVETPIIIDDFLPTLTTLERFEPYFARSREPELWISLLEKAWAKYLGSYIKIKAGLSRNVAIHLMGTAATEINHGTVDDRTEFFNMLMRSYHKGNTMMATAMNEDEPLGSGETNAQGIVQLHAYSILKVHATWKTDDEFVSLIKLRNPHGEGEWNGAYSDGSDLWTDELKEEVGFECKHDGAFWMPFEDYMKEFGYT